jgi:putative Holliday junction resolvase
MQSIRNSKPEWRRAPQVTFDDIAIKGQNMARLMALDVGEARIGVATCDITGTLASPYTTIQVSRSEEHNWTTIQRLLAETEAEGIVIGLPISLDGQLHGQGQRVQSFAERLRPYLSVPLIFWDERLSTVEAERLRTQMYEVSGKRQKRTGRGQAQSKHRQRGPGIDALAATVILQDYLDHLDNTTEDKGV